MSELMKLFGNFHNHTTHSDGKYTPAELVAVAAEEGYRALSITDHDTYTGNAEAAEACRAAGLAFLPGIEFSTRSSAMNQWFHMTAFSFDATYPAMQEYLKRLSDRETHQTRTLVERALKSGELHGFTWDEVEAFNKGITWLCNEHVFRLMKAKGLATDLDYPTFFKNVFGQHRQEVPPLYDFMEVEELIPLVHAAGGVIYVAHPYSQLHTIADMKKLGVDGIEVWHGWMPAEKRREALRLAGEYDLFVSGGADHEGLCGGEYACYENPEESEFYFPPLSLGTTEYFAGEMLTGVKKADRRDVIDALVSDDTLWERIK